jgi:RNA polymerase sigma-70 factor (ECF subfamily)
MPASKMGNPSEAVENKEILAAVEDSLQYLSDKHRAVIVMRELQGMSYSDMAKAMNCSKGTIMSRLFHARRNMQKLLRQRLEQLPDPSEDGNEALTHEAALP